MANGYPADEPETPADVPDEPDPGEAQPTGQPAGQPAKVSKAEANYRESNKVQCCGLCPHWHDCETNWGSCKKVEGDGDISCFGLCNLYERGDNPFRQGETGEFTGGTPVPLAAMMAPGAGRGGPNLPGGETVTAAVSPPPQISNRRVGQTSVMSPRLRIGGKSYGG